VAPASESASRLTAMVLQQPMAVHLENVTLQKALKIVGQTANVTINYSRDLIPVAKRVSLISERTTLGEILEVFLAGTDIVPVAFSPREIMLQPTSAHDLIASNTNLMQGTATISGYVHDSGTG